MTDEDLAGRLADLEERVARLEGPPTPAPGGGGAGSVQYSGEVHLHGDLSWTIVLDARTALDLADEPRLAVLAALGHPVRARIARTLLDGGPCGTAVLQEASGVASAGQLYHHLKSLLHAGVVEQDQRGSYRVPATATVPVLVLLTAAADVAGQLRG